jgi:hypothetical protein
MGETQITVDQNRTNTLPRNTVESLGPSWNRESQNGNLRLADAFLIRAANGRSK